MSGGAGTRLWPMSVKAMPKQYHALTGGKSMLAETLARVDGITSADLLAPSVICNTAHEALALAALDEAGHGEGTAILEPTGKNTAAAAALACHRALELDSDALVLLLAADHHITDPAAFHAAIAKAVPLAAAGRLVTFGIEAERAETGYGYIHRGAPLEGGFEIAGFREKPDAATAAKYLSDGGYYWNAGIFLLNARAFLAELADLRPDIAEPVAAAYASAARADRSITPSAGAWAATASDSIDYAVAEKTKSGAVVPVSMGWSDVGSWSAIHDLSAKDADGNAATGEALFIESSGNLVINESKQIVTLAGCEDMVVVETDTTIFIAPRDKAQKAKEIVAELKRLGKDVCL